MNRTPHTTRPAGKYANSRSNERGWGASAAATARARALFDQTAAAGGPRGTSGSAGNYDRLVGFKCFQNIGNQAVFRPIATANHIASTG